MSYTQKFAYKPVSRDFELQKARNEAALLKKVNKELHNRGRNEACEKKELTNQLDTVARTNLFLENARAQDRERMYKFQMALNHAERIIQIQSKEIQSLKAEMTLLRECLPYDKEKYQPTKQWSNKRPEIEEADLMKFGAIQIPPTVPSMDEEGHRSVNDSRVIPPSSSCVEYS